MAARAHDEPMDVDALPDWQRARREQVVDAAQRLLAEHPYEQIQVRDVAKAAGVALGTLYRYFGSKEHLYAVALVRWAEPVQASAPRAGTTVEERLRAKVHLVTRAFEKHPHVYSMILALQPSTDAAVQALLMQYEQSSAAWLVSDLQVLGPERAHELSQMLWAIIRWVVRVPFADGSGSFAGGRHVADRFIDLIAAELAESEQRG